MGMEFGWWDKDADGFSRKTGHNSSWEDFAPTDAQWDRLIGEAERRLPRRLMSSKEFALLKGQRPQ